MGTDAIPSFVFQKNHLINKSYLTKKMIENKILASNMIYINIFHNKKNLLKYEKVLNEIFYDLSKKNIKKKLNFKLCYKPINRIN